MEPSLDIPKLVNGSAKYVSTWSIFSNTIILSAVLTICIMMILYFHNRADYMRIFGWIFVCSFFILYICKIKYTHANTSILNPKIIDPYPVMSFNPNAPIKPNNAVSILNGSEVSNPTETNNPTEANSPTEANNSTGQSNSSTERLDNPITLPPFKLNDRRGFLNDRREFLNDREKFFKPVVF